MEKQAVISSFFTQSPKKAGARKTREISNVVDLTLDSDEENTGPPAKRRKTETSTGALVASPYFSQQRAQTAREENDGHGLVEKYGWNPTQARPPQPQSTREGNRRVQGVRRLLLADNNVFALRSQQQQPEKENWTEDEADREADGIAEVEPEPELEVEESEAKFNETIAFFTSSRNKGKGKKAGGAKQASVTTQVKPSIKPRKAKEIGPSGLAYTELEMQVLEMKRAHPGTMLMFEVGYRIRFFGEDAQLAAKLLSIACYPQRNFLGAMIPVHRREVHLKKLLSQGLKVGYVEQTESSALKKASESSQTRNTLFNRELTRLYTASTYVDELGSADADVPGSSDSSGGTPPLLCVVEELRGGMSADERVAVAVVGVWVGSGEVVWDWFDDNHMRTELETRLAHITPAEFLILEEKTSKTTGKLVKHFVDHSNTDHKVRIEKIGKDRTMEYTEAFDYVTRFYTRPSSSSAATASSPSNSTNVTSVGTNTYVDNDVLPLSGGNTTLLASLPSLPKPVLLALAHTIKYLSTFGVEGILRETRFWKKFREGGRMLLGAGALRELEIFRNETDFRKRGSLIWVLDRTVTRFGGRVLRDWIGRPLVDIRAIQERQEAIAEIASTSSDKITTLRGLLKRMPDLSRALCRVQYGKCNPREVSTLLTAFTTIGTSYPPSSFPTPSSPGFKSSLLNSIFFSLPQIHQVMRWINERVNVGTLRRIVKKEIGWKIGEEMQGIGGGGGAWSGGANGNGWAKEGGMGMWREGVGWDEIEGQVIEIQIAESDLKEELKAIRKQIQKPALQFSTVAGEEYLIEIAKSEKRTIPTTWRVISSTSKHTRYRSPTLTALLAKLSQHRELLALAHRKALKTFLEEMNEQWYPVLRIIVDRLGVADVLIGLAGVVAVQGWVKPEFVDDEQGDSEKKGAVLELVEGRHPMVELLRDDPFVPNTIRMGVKAEGGGQRCKIITGPNMGGKSCTVRMVALCAILAQIGCYVPAESMKLSLLDGILVRMGASDELARGRSTFFVEMQETSTILALATPRTLVILDELGRGTSTFDGAAIAWAVLTKLATGRCDSFESESTVSSLATPLTLFTTHYTTLSHTLSLLHPTLIQNLHMAFTEDSRANGTREVTFLYKLTEGLATESFGVECARLAGIPEEVLTSATEQSEMFKGVVEGRERRGRLRRCTQLVNETISTQSINNATGRLKELKVLMNILAMRDFTSSD